VEQRQCSSHGRIGPKSSGHGGAGGSGGGGGDGGGQHEDLWDVKRAAAYLRVSTAWIYKQVDLGLFPVVKFRGSPMLRFKPADVRAFASGEWAPPLKTA
jgi:hypothetical protein